MSFKKTFLGAPGATGKQGHDLNIVAVQSGS